MLILKAYYLNYVFWSQLKLFSGHCVHNVLPAVCCSSFAWPVPGCPVLDSVQGGYCWPGEASGWGKAEMVMEGHHLTEHHPGPEKMIG